MIPLTDARGDAAEHLRTWTHGQTLPRDRYQMVIASDAEEPETDRDVTALLEPHDVLEMAPGAGLLDLYNAAAAAANSRWLLFTENHCEAERDTLKRAVAGIDAAPSLEAASLEHGHLTPAVVGELGARWFDQVYEEWFSPGAWRRLSLAGFLIRRDAFESAGGLDRRYGLFSTPLLAARLDDRGAKVGHLPSARILHVHVDDIDEHHDHSTDYALGEIEARASLPPEFAERYFGHQHLLWNRAALDARHARRTTSVLARELIGATRRRRRDTSWLGRELGSRLPAALAGSRPRLRLTRIGFAWSNLWASAPVLSRRRRYRHYLRAQERVVRLTQLRWIAAQPRRDRPVIPPGSHRIDELSEGALIGVHGLERHQDRPFRWSEAVLTLTVPAGGGQLRLDTGGLRGSPLSSLRAAYLGRRRLTAADLSEKGSTLVLNLPRSASGDLTLLTEPLAGGGDGRILGLPIFSIELKASR